MPSQRFKGFKVFKGLLYVLFFLSYIYTRILHVYKH